MSAFRQELQIHTPPAARNPQRAGRRWLFRLMAMALGFAPVCLAEGVLALIDVRTTREIAIADATLSRVRPLFVRRGDSYTVAPERRTYFAPATFPVHKPLRGFRIFCLGGSTVQGNPYSTSTAFAKWLELALAQADPGRPWEVINCGGVSYASYRLVPILNECLSYDPDLIIICTGHNEFLEDRCYGPLKNLPESLEPAWDWILRRQVVAGSRLLASQIFPRLAQQGRPVFKEETDPLLNYRNGLAAYHRDPERAKLITRHFGSNLRKMIQQARELGVPVILIQPPCNLSNTPPFKTEPGPDLSDEERQEFARLMARAREFTSTELNQAIPLFEQACRIDPLHALARFELGCCQLARGDFISARESFVAARDLDICPLRMTTDLQRVLQAVAGETRTPLLDAHALLESKTRNGILGGFLIVDHVHPSFEGQQQIAVAILHQMALMRLLVPAPGWEDLAARRWSEHFAELPSSYFHQGTRHLEALRLWTQGKSAGPDIATSYSHLLRGNLSHVP